MGIIRFTRLFGLGEEMFEFQSDRRILGALIQAFTVIVSIEFLVLMVVMIL